MICLHCEQVLAPDEVPGRCGLEMMHYECSIRCIVGSVAHQRRTCTCYGGNGEDDPALTRRQNARLACAEWEKRLESIP